MDTNLSLVRGAVQWARHNGAQPRVHPNGFIQLDLEEDGTRIAKARLHVWPDGDDIPRQSTVTTVHDHKFTMRSTVITGVLYQHRYLVQLDPSGPNFTDEIFTAQYPGDRKESQLTGTGVLVWKVLQRTEQVNVGRSYTQPPYAFHDTGWTGLTATLMEKLDEDHDHNPRVLVPLGERPDNSFVRADVDTDLLWDYIERAMR